MTDERRESLAAQAASWVPPWEREKRAEPDRAYQAQVLGEGEPEAAGEPEAPGDPAAPGDVAPRAQSGPESAELPPIADETPGRAVVDAPLEPEPEGGPSVPVPASIEDAAAEESVIAVDAPVPAEGDDAGDVFDAAADDDVSDDDVDIPFTEDVPDESDETEAEPESEPASPAVDKPAAAGIPAQKRKAARPAPEEAGAADARTPEVEESAPLADGELRAALESVLLVVDEPVGELHLAQIMEEPVERIAAMLDEISAAYDRAGNGIDLRRAAGGWRLYTRPQYAAYVEKFVLDGQSVRLTQAALETLAVVAYKQPVTRSRISAIRGVNCDGTMRTLATRGLISECGTERETGAFLYRTTGLFLEKLGLNSVDQLPPLAPFLPDDVEEVLDAQG